jgi:hypothetical protein
MTPAAGARWGLLLAAALLLAGCGSTQQASEHAKSKWIGRNADDFFRENGPPKRDYAMAAGGKVYSWETVSLPSGTRIQLICSADIVTDARSAITEIRMREDSIGHWNTSRCSEIFNAG